MVKQREGLLLAAFDIEGEGRTRSRTLTVEHRLVGVALLEEAEIVHPGDLGMARQIFRDETVVGVRPRHADLSSVSRERISIQQEFGSSCVPMELRQLITCFTRLASPLMLPPTSILMKNPILRHRRLR